MFTSVSITPVRTSRRSGSLPCARACGIWVIDSPAPVLLETALTEISELPLDARHRTLVYYRSLDPDWQFWRSLHLHVSDLFAFDSSPQVLHLVALLDEAPVLGVAVLSQEKARALTWTNGQVEEHEIPGLEADVVHATAPAGTLAAGPGGARVGALPGRVADRNRRRLSLVAQRLGELGRSHGWARLLLIGSPAVIEAVVAALPDRLRRLLIDPFDRNLINAPSSEIAVAAGRRLHDWKRTDELREVNQLIDEATAAGRSRLGLAASLDHLNEKRVERLYFCRGLRASGFRDASGRLRLQPSEPSGTGATVPEPRLVNRMVVAALEAGAQVVPLEGESAHRLAGAGGCGVRLRWRGNGAFPEPI